CLAALAEQTFEIRLGLLIDEQLPRIGSPFLDNGRRLTPEELGTSGAEAVVAAERQFIRSTVERAVTALHRLNTQSIADSKRTDLDWSEQRAEILAKTEIEPESARFGGQLVDRFELEVARQDRPLTSDL